MSDSIDLPKAEQQIAGPGTLSQVARNLSEFVAASVEAARAGEAPFHHLVLDRVFPDDVYAAMLRAMPSFRRLSADVRPQQGP